MIWQFYAKTAIKKNMEFKNKEEEAFYYGAFARFMSVYDFTSKFGGVDENQINLARAEVLRNYSSDVFELNKLFDLYIKIKYPLFKPAPKLKTMTDKELREYEPPFQDWLVEKILLPRTLMVLGAKTAAGKSWIGIHAAYCISNGFPVFGHFKTKKGRVLYIDRENGKPELHNRQALIKAGLGLTDDSDIIWMSEEELKLDKISGSLALEEKIIKENIILVIIDTYRRVVSYKENDADEVSKFLDDTIKPICYRTGAAFIFIHHESKGKDKSGMDRIRGSSDLTNNVESVLQLEKEGDFISCYQTKIRGAAEMKPFSIKIDTDKTSFFKLTYRGDSVFRSADEKLADRIYVWASSKISFKVKDVVRALKVARTIVYPALDILKASGRVIPKGDGYYEAVIKGDSAFRTRPNT